MDVTTISMTVTSQITLSSLRQSDMQGDHIQKLALIFQKCNKKILIIYLFFLLLKLEKRNHQLSNVKKEFR